MGYLFSIVIAYYLLLYVTGRILLCDSEQEQAGRAQRAPYFSRLALPGGGSYSPHCHRLAAAMPLPIGLRCLRS